MNNQNNNNNPGNLSSQNLDSLLNIAGQKLGRDPQQLKNQLQSGNFEGLGINPDQQRQISQLLSDQGAMSRMLESPQVRMILGKLMKGK